MRTGTRVLDAGEVNGGCVHARRLLGDAHKIDIEEVGGAESKRVVLLAAQERLTGEERDVVSERCIAERPVVADYDARAASFGRELPFVAIKPKP